MSNNFSLSAAKVALRISGITCKGHGSRTALSALRLLQPRLQALSMVLPNLQKTFELIFRLTQLNDSRVLTKVEPDQKRALKGGVLNFVCWLLSDPESPLHRDHPHQDADLFFDVIAVRWVYATAMRCYSDQVPGGFPFQPKSPNKDFEDLLAALAAEQLQSLPPAALKTGYLTWFADLNALVPEGNLSIIFSQLLAIKEIPFLKPTPRNEDPIPRLSERQLCKSHWLYPRPHELKQLHVFLDKQLDPSDPSTARHEAALIALSISFGRPIQTFLKWRILGDPSEHKGGTNSIVFVDGVPHWLKAEHGLRDAVAKVPFPFTLNIWLRAIHPGHGRHSLHDLLPFSEVAWDQRAYACLAKKIGCNRKRAELITRDLLARETYSMTCNSALVDFWRNDGINKIDRPDRVALSHYLQPTGLRLSSSYAAAVACATGLGKPNLPNVRVTLGSAPLQLEEVKLILAILRKSKDEALSFSEKHNTTAFWTLFVILLATGHRRSTMPFPFPWDFSPSEGLVFICDKLVTGSEARFVPMAPIALKCLADYATHLKKVSTSVSVKQSARDYACQTQALLSFDKELSPLAKSNDFLPESGVFFLLSNDGFVSNQRLMTNTLDRFIEEKTGMRHTVRRLRTTMAQHLWEHGASGRAIQAFLGHQPEMHAHGPESTWSVQDLADMLAPKINAYFEIVLNQAREQKVTGRRHFSKAVKAMLDATPKMLIKSPWTFPSNFVSLQTAASYPANEKPVPGYEGREREGAWAEQRVRAAIRREVSQYMLEGQEPTGAQPKEGDVTTQFTPEDRQRIAERVRSELGSDSVGLRKVNAALDKIIDKNLRARGLKVQPDPKYRLSSPGPIDINFSRALRCALVLRGMWEQNVGTPIVSNAFDPLERLAHLAISLVCFDAVLAEENLEGLVLAVAEQGSKSLGTKGTVRCHVVTPSHDYEFSVRPGFFSIALILGCAAPTQELPAFDWEQIQKRVVNVLVKLLRLHKGMKWSTSRLCQVFRPYWLIRLPGAMYSVATGEHKGPAADARAEAQLHGAEPTSEVQSTSRQAPERSSREQNQKSALSALRGLLSASRGILESGGHKSNVQRRKLGEILKSDFAVHVLKHGEDSQTVGLLLSFLGRLLDKGGPVKTRLAFTTIESYFSPIAEALIELAWDFDFESAGSEELLDLFSEVQKKLKTNHADLILTLFCNHLRDELSIPAFNTRWFGAREPVRIRSSIVMPDHVGDAMGRLHKKGDEASSDAATFIALSFGYGLRRNEAFGLNASCFDIASLSHLSVKSSPISDLKSASGRRTITGSINREAAVKKVTTAVTTARGSTRPNAFIFESLTRDQVIKPVRPISARATDALRLATGSLKVVPHTLRHSYATLLGLGLFAQKASGSSLDLPCLKIFHNSFTQVIQLDEVLNMPTDWPFGVDAIATALGHADCSTLLNVYFHGSHLVIAYRSEPWQPKIITQARLANVLNMERTRLSKRWGKFSKGKKFDAHAVVRALIEEISTSKPDGPEAPEVSDDSVWSPTRWDLFIRVLEYRQKNNLSLDGLRDYAVDGLMFSSEKVESLLSTYRGLVEETAFDDFEPTSSELIDSVASHQKGVERGANERRDFIARAQAWAKASDANSASLRALLENWKSRLSAIKPLIVCRTMDELNQWLGLLKLLEAHPDQLTIGLHGDLQDSFLGEARRLHPLSDIITTPASRGNARLKRNEVSISVHQRPKSKVPDGRDLHRALVGLYVALCS
jgi:site-specific recombinase XerD